MKQLAYKLFACAFNACARLPQRDRVALLSPHMASFTDSLGEMEREMRSRGYAVVRVSGADIRPKRKNAAALARMLRFFTKGAYDLATASMVFLNDNFMPLADLRVRKSAVWTQLWHAEGAFKRFGLDIADLPQDVRERVMRGNAKLRYVICSSESVAPVYASAFGVPQEKVLPLGSPRADRYIEKNSRTDTRALRVKLFGETDKTIVLYAPTFRDDPAENRALLEHFDFPRFQRELGDRFLLVLRLHPQFHDVPVPEGVTNLTDYPDAGDLIAASDLLITDYSSLCLDFALVGKPSVFYAFDLESYAAGRSFYRDYKANVPGAVARTFDELIAAVRNAEADGDAMVRFSQYHFGTPDGKAASRIADAVIRAANLQ